MRIRSRRGSSVAALWASVCVAWAAQPAAPEASPVAELSADQLASPEELADVAARQIARLAFMDLRLRSAPAEADYEIAAALLAVAQTFAPEDVELLRRRIEAAYAAGDDAAVVALSRELVRLDPRDEVALLRVISANLSNLQTADERLLAYQRLLGPAGVSISPAVRSRLALDAALLLRERGATEQFGRLLGNAVTLDPTNKNAAALALSFFQERLPGEAAQEIELMMNLMLCDPLDPQAHIKLYQRAAQLGAYRGAAQFQQTAKLILTRSGVTETDSLDADGLAIAWRGQGPGAIAESLTADITIQREAAARQLRLRREQDLPTEGVTPPEDTRLSFAKELFRLLSAHASGNAEILAASMVDYATTTDEAQTELSNLLNEPDADRDAIARQGLMQIIERFAVQALVAYEPEIIEQNLRTLESTPALPAAAVGVLRGFQRLSVGDHAGAIEAFEASPRGLPQLRPLGLIEAYIRAGRLEEAAEIALRVERSQPLSVFGAWAWSKRLEALGEIPRDSQVETIERTLNALPRWLSEVFEDPHRFMDLQVRPLSRTIGPLGGMRTRIELRNVSTVPMAVGTQRTFGAKALVTMSVDAGAGDLSDMTTPEVVYLDRRLRLMPQESLYADVVVDAGASGWVAETAADEIVRQRARVIQGFRVGNTALFEPGPFSLAATSASVQRLRFPEADLAPDQLALRAANAPAARLPWVAGAVRAGLFKLGKGYELTSDEARPIIEALAARYPQIEDRAVRAALACILPHERQFPVMGVFDEAVRGESDPALRLVAMASRSSGADDPMIGAAAGDDPLLRRFAILLAERLSAGAPSYSIVGPDPEVLRGGAAFKR